MWYFLYIEFFSDRPQGPGNVPIENFYITRRTYMSTTVTTYGKIFNCSGVLKNQKLQIQTQQNQKFFFFHMKAEKKLTKSLSVVKTSPFTFVSKFRNKNLRLCSCLQLKLGYSFKCYPNKFKRINFKFMLHVINRDQPNKFHFYCCCFSDRQCNELQKKQLQPSTTVVKPWKNEKKLH